jgi:acetyl esterase
MSDLFDPEVQLPVARIEAAYSRHPDIMTIPMDQGRILVEEVRRPWRGGGPVMADTTERMIGVLGGAPRIRWHHATRERGQPALIDLHCRGFTSFSTDTRDRVMREHAARAGIRVIGVDYPPSPEGKFSQGPDQIAALVEWLADHGADLGVNSWQLAIGGDTAGENLPVTSALELRDSGRTDLLEEIVLNYPGLLTDKFERAKARFGGERVILLASGADTLWANYDRGPENSINPLVNVLTAGAAGLPQRSSSWRKSTRSRNRPDHGRQEDCDGRTGKRACLSGGGPRIHQRGCGFGAGSQGVAGRVRVAPSAPGCQLKVHIAPRDSSLSIACLLPCPRARHAAPPKPSRARRWQPLLAGAM